VGGDRLIGRGGRAGGRAHRCEGSALGRRAVDHRPHAPVLAPPQEASARAPILSPRMAKVMSSAPPQASRCQASYGLMANWKITTGRLAIGASRFKLQNWLLSAVNSSGAVSPLIRAIASKTPVTRPCSAAR